MTCSRSTSRRAPSGRSQDCSLSDLYSREGLLVDRGSEHIGRTLQRFHDEKAILSSTAHSFEDFAAQDMRQEEMVALLRHANAVVEVDSARKMLDEESAVREAEDNVLLDSIFETQQLLQSTVIQLHLREYLFKALNRFLNTSVWIE